METLLLETILVNSALVKDFSFTCMGIGVERGRLLASLHPPPINVRKPVVRHHIFGTVSSWKANFFFVIKNNNLGLGGFISVLYDHKESPWVFFISPIFENTQVLLQCRFWTRESNWLSSNLRC